VVVKKLAELDRGCRIVIFFPKNPMQRFGTYFAVPLNKALVDSQNESAKLLPWVLYFALLLSDNSGLKRCEMGDDTVSGG
jgi:hypothetical protein